MRPIAVAPVLLGCLVVSSCSADAGGAGSEVVVAPAATAVKEFTGTPLEMTRLRRACYEDRGIETDDDPFGDQTGFSYSNVGRTQAELAAIDAECDAQIGVPKMAGLSEAELRERFEARDTQYSCLDELGYENHPRLSYDEFVDEYERSGQTYLWEPAAVIDGPPGGDANVDCPRTGVW